MWILVFVLLASAYAEEPRLDGKIIGGEPISIEDVPYQISMQYYGSHICGGSIISEKYVVTAAHCTEGIKHAALSIRVGSSHRERGGRLYPVAKVHQNKNYNKTNMDSDITILEFSYPIVFGKGVSKVLLPEPLEEFPSGTTALVSGWGYTSEGGLLSDPLLGINIETIAQDVCKSKYEPATITDKMFCAGTLNGTKDSCQGDSGGPLVINRKLVGVVSWGFGCARPDFPGIYASVPHLRAFITDITRI